MRDNNNEDYIDDLLTKSNKTNESKANKEKAHKVRRNLEDFLERRALKKRLTDVFEDDYLLD